MRILQVRSAVPIQDAVVGTLHHVDDRLATITVYTPTGPELLNLSSSVLVHQGARTLSVRELSAHADEPVKVWYRQTNGHRVATEVRLVASAPEPTTAGDARP